MSLAPKAHSLVGRTSYSGCNNTGLLLRKKKKKKKKKKILSEAIKYFQIIILKISFVVQHRHYWYQNNGNEKFRQLTCFDYINIYI